jgi:hypothetical protein
MLLSPLVIWSEKQWRYEITKWKTSTVFWKYIDTTLGKLSLIRTAIFFSFKWYIFFDQYICKGFDWCTSAFAEHSTLFQMESNLCHRSWQSNIGTCKSSKSFPYSSLSQCDQQHILFSNLFSNWFLLSRF